MSKMRLFPLQILGFHLDFLNHSLKFTAGGGIYETKEPYDKRTDYQKDRDDKSFVTVDQACRLLAIRM